MAAIAAGRKEAANQEMTNMEIVPYNTVKDIYLAGYDHSVSGGYYRSEYGEWQRIAYDLGWEDGQGYHSASDIRRDLLERIQERWRAEHGVVQ